MAANAPSDQYLCAFIFIILPFFIMIQLNELKSQIERLPGLDLNEGIHLNSADDTVLISMVAQGLGVTVMTELCLRGKEQSGVCIYPITPELRRIYFKEKG